MGGRKKILIVDDEQLNLDFFDVMLSKLGFIVEKAGDGLEALEKVKQFHPDLIILDNIMPKMSGWEVTKTLKKDAKYREIPIIMFSALGDVKDKVEGFELGVDDYITKPFNFSEVLARIRAVLRNRELFGQIVYRESRLNLAEAFGMDMKGKTADFIKSMDDLDAAISRISQDGEAAGVAVLAKHLDVIREKTSTVRKNIAELDAKIDQTIAEWQDLKKNEIEIQILEENIRKSVHQD
ncbi:MAG: response regulator [Treponema sp.]|jgi:CheY-like chemotaxis protein|nr:response regulator [Treponema sp.]